MRIPRDWRRPGVKRGYELFWCDTCRFGHLQPRPDPDEVADFYDVDDYYTHESNGSTAASPTGFMERLLIHLAWRFDAGRPVDAARLCDAHNGHTLKICDLGCGNGASLREMIDQGHEGLGVEPDAQARSVARADGLHVVEGTAESLPADLDRGAFDLVIMQHVLEHCVDPGAALRNAGSLLAPGGRVVIEVPNNAAIGLKRSGPCWPWLDVPRHLNFFTRASLTRVCTAAGFAVINVEYTGYVRQFNREWIETEERITDCFHSCGTTWQAARCSVMPAWRLLARTLLASAEMKYDSLRVVAVQTTDEHG